MDGKKKPSKTISLFFKHFIFHVLTSFHCKPIRNYKQMKLDLGQSEKILNISNYPSVFLVLFCWFSRRFYPCLCLCKPDRLSPPLDIQLETLNCSAFSVRWKMPRRHVSTITGYKVNTNSFYMHACIVQYLLYTPHIL